MVRRGLAEVYRGRAPDRNLVTLEREARATGRGIWGLACYESPAAYRHRKLTHEAGACESR
jgi:endonuclease YncB( thermonuclease family)